MSRGRRREGALIDTAINPDLAWPDLRHLEHESALIAASAPGLSLTVVVAALDVWRNDGPVTGDELLAGGRSNRGQVSYRDGLVVRPYGDDQQTESVMSAVAEVFRCMPAPMGRDPEGRLLLTWVDGDAPESLCADGVSDPSFLFSLGQLLRQLHDATEGVVASLAPMTTGLSDPTGIREVVCHCDPTPGNVVLSGGRAVGLIDWEYASPGRRAWDLATALRFWSPLRSPSNFGECEATFDPVDRARAVLDGYDASSALRLECVDLFVPNQNVSADNALRVINLRTSDERDRWERGGGPKRIAADAEWLKAATERLRVELL